MPDGRNEQAICYALFGNNRKLAVADFDFRVIRPSQNAHFGHLGNLPAAICSAVSRDDWIFSVSSLEFFLYIAEIKVFS